MPVPRQIIVDLVENDTLPDLTLRFLGLDLGDYSTIEMHVDRFNGADITRTVVPDGSDPEVGRVTWQAGDLRQGRNYAEIEFTDSGGKKMTLPRRFRMILDVRREIA